MSHIGVHFNDFEDEEPKCFCDCITSKIRQRQFLKNLAEERKLKREENMEREKLLPRLRNEVRNEFEEKVKEIKTMYYLLTKRIDEQENQIKNMQQFIRNNFSSDKWFEKL